MRRIDPGVESAVAIRKSGNGRELSDFAAGVDPRGVDGIGRIRRKSILAVLDAGVQLAGDVLVESASKRDVQALTAVADGQNWFAGSKGVLQDGEIRLLAMGIGVVGLFMARGAVERRVHVAGGAGKDKGVQIFDLGAQLLW